METLSKIRVVNTETDYSVRDPLALHETNTTLSVAGMAADAKAVGDRITDEVSTLSEEINVERKRIDNLIASSGENTVSNDELLDIRTGFDGTIYDSAGNAVREQVKTNIRAFEQKVSASIASSRGWHDFLDMPTNYLYRFSSDLPDAFGMPVYGKSGTLISFDAGNKDTGDNWDVVYICTVRTSESDSKYYIAYVKYGCLLSDVHWEEISTDIGQEVLDSISSAVARSTNIGQFITLENTVLDINTKTDTITLNNGYLHTRAGVIRIEQSPVARNTSDDMSLVVYDSSLKKVMSIAPSSFTDAQTLIAILTKSNPTSENANYVPGVWSVDGVLAPTPIGLDDVREELNKTCYMGDANGIQSYLQELKSANIDTAHFCGEYVLTKKITIPEGMTISGGTFIASDDFTSVGEYLYSYDKANGLQSQTNLTDNGSWTISINGSTGVATCTSRSVSTYGNIIRYNDNDGSKIFTCYSSNTEQKNIMIYKVTTSLNNGDGYYGYGQGVATLVKDVSTLKYGDQIILAAEGKAKFKVEVDGQEQEEEKDVYCYMSGSSSNNGYKAAAITLVSEGNSTIKFDANAKIITLQKGKVDGTFGFAVGGWNLFSAGGPGIKLVGVTLKANSMKQKPQIYFTNNYDGATDRNKEYWGWDSNVIGLFSSKNSDISLIRCKFEKIIPARVNSGYVLISECVAQDCSMFVWCSDVKCVARDNRIHMCNTGLDSYYHVYYVNQNSEIITENNRIYCDTDYPYCDVYHLMTAGNKGNYRVTGLAQGEVVHGNFRYVIDCHYADLTLRGVHIKNDNPNTWYEFCNTGCSSFVFCDCDLDLIGSETCERGDLSTSMIFGGDIPDALKSVDGNGNPSWKSPSQWEDYGGYPSRYVEYNNCNIRINRFLSKLSTYNGCNINMILGDQTIISNLCNVLNCDIYARGDIIDGTFKNPQCVASMSKTDGQFNFYNNRVTFVHTNARSFLFHYKSFDGLICNNIFNGVKNETYLWYSNASHNICENNYFKYCTSE
jgi:hypothetical protein